MRVEGKTDKTYLAPLQYLQYLREPSTVNLHSGLN